MDEMPQTDAPMGDQPAMPPAEGGDEMPQEGGDAPAGGDAPVEGGEEKPAGW